MRLDMSIILSDDVSIILSRENHGIRQHFLILLLHTYLLHTHLLHTQYICIIIYYCILSEDVRIMALDDIFLYYYCIHIYCIRIYCIRIYCIRSIYVCNIQRGAASSSTIILSIIVLVLGNSQYTEYNRLGVTLGTMTPNYCKKLSVFLCV